MWTIEEGIKFCWMLEPILAESGWHCALAGSVLYVGKSNKDLDIVIYPHDTSNSRPDDVEYILNKLTANYHKYVPSQVKRRYPDSKDIWVGEYEGKRIDFFLMR